MSSHRSQDTRPPGQDTYRSRYDRDLYSYHRSRSRSRDRRYSSPRRRRSPSHEDSSRTPPRGPPVDMRSGYARDWDRRRDRDQDRYRDHDASYRRTPSPYRRQGGYRDREIDGYRSPGYDSRSRSRSRSPRRRGRERSRDRSPYYGGPPSKEVMLEGLPADMVEEDISSELRQSFHVDYLEDVRVIRDRQTKRSRQFGFLRFSTLEDSRDFVERNYPMIYLYGSRSSGSNEQPAKIRIAYSRERDERPRADLDWTCKICNTSNYSTRSRCFRCSTPRAEAQALPPPKAANNGDSDVSPDNTPSQFLIIRGLEPTATEELLAKGVLKLYKSSSTATPQQPPPKKGFKVVSTTGDTNLGAREGSLRRVLLVRDRRSNESWRYGFAEFATVDDAQAALLRYNSFEKFTISSKPVLASYIHAGVFVPVLNPTPSTERFTFSPLSNAAMKLAYWDENAYVTELTVSSIEPENGSNGKAKSDNGAAEGQGESLVRSGKDGEKSKKRKADLASASNTKKPAPSHLQFWSNRHAELHGIEKTAADSSLDLSAKDQSTTSSAAKQLSPGVSTEGSTPPRTFADLNRNCCLLCSRQFKSVEEVHKHERLSLLHRDNLTNEILKAKALKKMEKLGLSTEPSSSQPEYRDRARERRLLHKLPMKSKDSNSNKPTTQNAKSTSPPPDRPAQQSRGASLLSKMGYDASSPGGLGRDGTGISEPIQTDIYTPGVGLGAEGGKRGDAVKEGERNTRDGEKGYEGFMEKVKEGARERYERLG